MPFSWLLWWWFLSSLKRKIKSYQGEEYKCVKVFLIREGWMGQRGSHRALCGPTKAVLKLVIIGPSCAQAVVLHTSPGMHRGSGLRQLALQS